MMASFEEHMEIVPNWVPLDPRGTFLGLAIAGEGGELANIYKKTWRAGEHPDNHRKRIEKELGDVMAYCLMLAHHLHLDLYHLAEQSLLEFESRPEYKELLAKCREIRK